MRATFTRMKPDSTNMVVEPGLPTQGRFTDALLCVECGWEGTAVAPTAPWVVFKDHPCRFLTESVSTAD
jgi:hypothetical protein